MLIILTLLVLGGREVVASRGFSPSKLEPLIECGLELLSSSNLYIKQYKIVLFYLIFDLEVLILLPSLINYSDSYFTLLSFLLLLSISIFIEIKSTKSKKD